MNFHWDDLRILIAIDGAGTLLGASKAIGISHSTVARRLDALERAFKTKLFRRQNNLLVRTETADAILGLARRISHDMNELAGIATNADAKLSGDVQLTGPHAMLTGFISSRLPKFSALYPDIRITLRSELGVEGLLRGTADIGLRISQPVSDRLDIRRVATSQFGLYGQAGLAARCKASLRRKEPLTVPYVDFAEDYGQMPESRWLQSLFPHSQPKVRANSTLILHSAACAGLGVAALPCYVGDALEGLRRIPTELPGPAEGLYIVTRPEQRKVAKVRALVDFLAQIISANKSLFLGSPSLRRSRRPATRRLAPDA